MTILDKARLHQTVYELAENDDSIENSNGTKNSCLEMQVSEFLGGLSAISYNVDGNCLIWRPNGYSVNLADIANKISNFA